VEVHRHSFPGTPASVPAARHFVRGVLRHPCGDDCPQAEIVSLLLGFIGVLHHHLAATGTRNGCLAHQPGYPPPSITGTRCPLRPVVPEAPILRG
jgi:hypothetical protein